MVMVMVVAGVATAIEVANLTTPEPLAKVNEYDQRKKTAAAEDSSEVANQLLRVEHIAERLRAAHESEVANRLFRPPVDMDGPTVIIMPDAGMGNRLRGLAAGVVFAQTVGLRARLEWNDDSPGGTGGVSHAFHTSIHPYIRQSERLEE